MQISRISNIPFVYTKSGNIFSSKNKNITNQNRNDKILEDKMPYLPANIYIRQKTSSNSISFKSKDFDKTVKENYFKLPENCTPDRFQIEAGKGILEGKDVLVEAPTGIGKTALAFYAAANNMDNGKITVYTAPLKALSNQKLNEFAVFGEENTGILTGDRRKNINAPILIMTTEVYRNMVLSNMFGDKNPLLENVGTVIFDEFHFLGDTDRGSVWEEAMMFTPKDIQILDLSATIGNASELKNWIGDIKSKDDVLLISLPSDERYVPLSFDMLYTDSYKEQEKIIEKKNKKGETFNFNDTLKVKKPKLNDFKASVEQLNDKEQLPAIFFVFSKKYSREVLEYMAEKGIDLNNSSEKDEIQEIINKYSAEKYLGADLNLEALKKGYAIHNSGIIPAQKELVEELFQKKLIKVVIATETLGAGINMPAKTVVISSPYKPCDEDSRKGTLLDKKIKSDRNANGEGHILTENNNELSETENESSPVRLLSSNEFKQMSGRAGRRGIDSVGYVYTMPVDRASMQDFLCLEAMEPNPVESNYNPDYAFLAGYYEHNQDNSKLEEIYNKTFYVYSEDENLRKNKLDELKEISSRKTQILLDRRFLIKENGEIRPALLANMASKVKGYDALTLSETISSEVFNDISPQALAMIAAGISMPPKFNETSDIDNNLSFVFEKTEMALNNIHKKLINSVNSMLTKLGKTPESFSDYEDMLNFVENTIEEQPQTNNEDLKNEMEILKARRDKMYKITKTTGNYSLDEIVNKLKNGEIISTKELETHFKNAQEFKKKINAKSIDDYIEKLNAKLDETNSSSKGNKAKARIERKRKEIQTSIQRAANMKYIDENVLSAIEANNEFIKQNPPQKVRQDYNNAEKKYINQVIREKLPDRIKAVEAFEEFGTSIDTEFISEYDSKKVKEALEILYKKSAEIYNTEIKNGINPRPVRFNSEAAGNVYEWARLNEVNPYDTMTNWKELAALSGKTDEGSLYKSILQTADLLSQISEMAYSGIEKAGTEAEREYYSELAKTSAAARKLLIQKPVEID